VLPVLNPDDREIKMLRFSYVYMMGSSSRRALYTGVAASLYKRVYEHRTGQGGYFTSKYKCYRLVYFEQFTNIEAAIAREKQIKGWSRPKKNTLVESLNPGWKDLAMDWYPETLLRDGKPVTSENEAQGPSGLLASWRLRLLAYGRRDDDV
jgi:putative endonuclease